MARQPTFYCIAIRACPSPRPVPSRPPARSSFIRRLLRAEENKARWMSWGEDSLLSLFPYPALGFPCSTAAFHLARARARTRIKFHRVDSRDVFQNEYRLRCSTIIGSLFTASGRILHRLMTFTLVSLHATSFSIFHRWRSRFHARPSRFAAGSFRSLELNVFA